MSKLHDRLNRKQEVWKPRPGDVIEGTVVEVTTYTVNSGTHPVYVVVDESGTIEMSITPAAVSLRDQLTPVHVGDLIAVRYEGEVEGQTTGRKYHNYRTVIEPAAPSSASTDNGRVYADIDTGVLFDDDNVPPEDDDGF